VPNSSKHFRLLKGSYDDPTLGTYKFYSKRVAHRFCTECGSNVFRQFAHLVILNANTIDGFEADRMTEVIKVDGRHTL
jgi:hypothetical protein